MSRDVRYRRVAGEEELEPHTRGYTGNSPNCILSCLMALLITLVLSLAAVFYVTRPYLGNALMHLSSSGHDTPTTTTTTTPTSIQSSTQSIMEEEQNGTINDGSSEDNDELVVNITLSPNATNSDKDLHQKLVQLIRQYESHLEKFTGLEGELLIPLLMLVMVLSVMLFVSCCCCMISKRREQRRRLLFGKIITDLQSGDSKRVLLQDSDVDE